MDHLLSSDGAIIESDLRQVKKEKQGGAESGNFGFRFAIFRAGMTPSLNGIMQSKIQLSDP